MVAIQSPGCVHHRHRTVAGAD